MSIWRAEPGICDPCWKELDGVGVEAHYFPAGIPMCEKHYMLVCQRCHRNWGSRIRTGEFGLVCENCDLELGRVETRKREYNQHLGSKQWWRTKKLVRRASVSENGRSTCARCSITEYENRYLHGEGLHGHHRTYERFGEERIEDIELLCSKCHALEHGLATRAGRRARRVLGLFPKV